LEGKITINQKTPMPQGMVFVFNSSSRQPVARGRIKPDGMYSILNTPAGEVQLVVTYDPSVRPSAQVTGGEPTAVRPGAPPRLGSRPVPPPSIGSESGPPESRPTPKAGGLDQKLVDALELKYGSLLGAGRILYVVVEGRNAFDIDLTIP
jgi:hypothetical protein